MMQLEMKQNPTTLTTPPLPSEAKAEDNAGVASPSSSSRTPGYTSPEYVKARQKVLDIIPSVSVWDSIDRYIGHISLALFGLGATAIFKNNEQDPSPKWVAPTLIGGGFVTALLGIYAHIKKRNLSEPAQISHMEAYKTEETKMLGYEIAKALREQEKPEPTLAYSTPETAQKEWAQEHTPTASYQQNAQETAQQQASTYRTP